MVQRAELLERVKRVVHEVKPEADIVLYGSRAHGEAHAESDGDFLILLDGVVDDARTDAIRRVTEPLQMFHDCSPLLRSHASAQAASGGDSGGSGGWR